MFRILASLNHLVCIGIALLAIWLAPACKSFAPEELPAAQERIAFEPFQAKPAVDLYLLRVDVYRRMRTYTVTRFTPEGYPVTETRQEPVPYHYLGADLGNGLFLDANGNLGISIVKLLELDDRYSFRVTRQGQGWFESDRVYEKIGDRITIEGGGLLASTANIEIIGDEVFIEGGFLSSSQRINLGEQEISYDPGGLFSDWSKEYARQAGPSTVEMRSASVSVTEQGRVAQAPFGFLRLEDNDTAIRYRYDTLFSEKEHAMTHSSERIAYVDEELRGFIFNFSGNRFTVTRSGGLFGGSTEQFLVETGAEGGE